MEVYSMAHQFNADPKDVMKIIKEEGRVNMLINSVLRKKAAAFIYGAAKKQKQIRKKQKKLRLQKQQLRRPKKTSML